ncbi:VasL domain-containing protein [Scandinavium tedordense]|uniref:VasL domain-containing protein n=1 Tax=Scandinavium tedordense TaxID=2926521 RepID=UPI00216650CC|nr:VasL domain-containing protein [Scandinavium tedordense]
MADPQLQGYEQQLKSQLTSSPLLALETGIQITNTATKLWPDSEQQRQATFMWQRTLNARAAGSPTLQGYQQTRQDLHAFAEQLVQREKAKDSFTLSYIKTVIYQAETALNKEIPIENLLTQYQQSRDQQQNTDVLERKINERIDALLSRWLLLKENYVSATTGK